MDLSVLNQLPAFMAKHKFVKVVGNLKDDYTDKINDDSYTDILNAVMVTSKIDDTNFHRPILDLDLECELLPSSTPGKFHLYINKVMTFEELDKLVKVMMEVGLINKGVYDNQIVKDKQLSLRLPWVKKGHDRSLAWHMSGLEKEGLVARAMEW